MTKSGFIILIGCLLMTARVVAADPLEGAWQLQAYRSNQANGEEVPAAGILIFRQGMFGMIYQMSSETGKLFGRAHGGSYTLEGKQLVFDMKTWVQAVAGAAGLPSVGPTYARIDLQQDILTIRFKSGSIQKLQRVKHANAVLPAVARNLRNLGEGDGKGRGLFITDQNCFVLMYADDDAGMGRAYGGFALQEMELKTRWLLAVDGSTGHLRVPNDKEDRLRLKWSDTAVEVRDGESAVLIFGE